MEQSFSVFEVIPFAPVIPADLRAHSDNN